jgi:hypothetical protein
MRPLWIAERPVAGMAAIVRMDRGMEIGEARTGVADGIRTNTVDRMALVHQLIVQMHATWRMISAMERQPVPRRTRMRRGNRYERVIYSW